MHTADKKWSALIIALVVMTLLSMMSTVFFEKIYRFSQRSEWIENSNVAYYKSLGIVEEALFTGWVDKYTPWNMKNKSYGSTNNSGSKITVSTGGTIIPTPGKWNSPYDKNYNTISIGQPVQIVIPNGLGNWSSINFKFRIPQVSSNSSTGVAIWATSSGYILWTLASSGVSLFASGETQIFDGTALLNTNQSIGSKWWTTNSGSYSQFGNFYFNGTYLGADGLSCTWFKCTLKLSLIRAVPTTDGREMSFLEYQINGFATTIPSQYMDIHAEWYAYGFLRSRDIQFPQITTNTALDFAVLQ